MWGDGDEVVEDWGLEDDELTGVDEAAHLSATSPHNDLDEPTPAQKIAGNYPMGHFVLAGLPLSFENPAGSTRYDLKHEPPRWKTVMRHHYGDILGTEGMDGDQIDVFVQPGTPDDWAGTVFVVDQVIGGKPDEHKVMLGFDSLQDASDAYMANYDPGWKGLGAITAVALDDFKAWIAGDTSRPFTESAYAPQSDVHGPAEVAGKAAAGRRNHAGRGRGDSGSVPAGAAGGAGAAEAAGRGDGPDRPVVDDGDGADSMTDEEAFADGYKAFEGLTVEQTVRVEYSDKTAVMRMDAAQAMRALDARIVSIKDLAKCLERRRK